MISLDRVLERANNLYRDVRGHDMASEQVKALAQALVEELNSEIDDLKMEIARVYQLV